MSIDSSASGNSIITYTVNELREAAAALQKAEAALTELTKQIQPLNRTSSEFWDFSDTCSVEQDNSRHDLPTSVKTKYEALKFELDRAKSTFELINGELGYIWEKVASEDNALAIHGTSTGEVGQNPESACCCVLS